MKDDFEQELNEEVTKRLEVMESPDYKFPNTFKKGDWIAVAIIVVVSFLIIQIATLTN